MAIQLFYLFVIAICVLVAVGIIRAKLCECNENPIRRTIFKALVVAQYAAAVGVMCIQILRPYKLIHGTEGQGWGINDQLWWLLTAMYTSSLLTAFNYEKLNARTVLRRIIVYVAVCALIIFIGQWAASEFFSEVHINRGVKFHVYTNSRRVAEFIIALIPTFLVFYCYSRRLFFRDKNLYKQLFYSVLPILLIYALSSYIYLRFELMSMEEHDKIGEQIGASG